MAGKSIISRGLVCGLLCSLLMLQACNEQAPRVFGTVERDRLTLTAPVGNTLISIEVIEGQQVEAGQVLLSLDPTEADAMLALRHAELAKAKALLAELQAGARIESIARAQAALAAADASVKETQQAFLRTQRLLATKVLTQADFDRVSAARDTAVAKKSEARQSLNELENGTRTEQLEQASAGVRAAQAAVTIAQKQRQDLTLVAAQDAVVDQLPWRVGDRVAAGTQLIALSATARSYVRVYLPATWLDKVKVGTQVELWVDGRDVPINARVRHIRSQPAFTPFYALNERDRARLMYLTDIDIPETEDLATGMALEVELPL
jgi:HlyD family secretion protein